MKSSTSLVFFPFDLFGGGGTAEGVHMLADAYRELVAERRHEERLTRAHVHLGRVHAHAARFETLKSYERWRARATRAAAKAWDQGGHLLWVTGSHLGMLPIYEELARRDANTLVVQLDGHLDIQDLEENTKQLSHGNFVLHCEPRPRIINVGHRDLLLPAEHVSRYFAASIGADRIACEFESSLAELKERVSQATRVFIDLDWDILDPAFFPAVTHPLPLGLNGQQLLRIIRACWSDRVIGVGMSEYDPGRDRDERSLSLAVWLLDWLLLKLHES